MHLWQYQIDDNRVAKILQINRHHSIQQHACIQLIKEGTCMQIPSQSQQQQLAVGREYTDIYLPAAHAAAHVIALAVHTR